MNPAKANVLRGSADGFASLREQELTRAGLERLPLNTGETALSENGGAQGGARGENSASGGQYRDEVVRHLEAAWQSLKLWRLTETTEAELKSAERLAGRLALLMQSDDWKAGEV